MTTLITGVAGFIGYHMAEALLVRDEKVVGVDNLNDYYDLNLKISVLAGQNFSKMLGKIIPYGSVSAGRGKRLFRGLFF